MLERGLLNVPRAGEDMQSAVWWRSVRWAGGRSAYVKDPNGHYLSLTGHVIEKDGTVKAPPGKGTDSVKCPSCGWDEHLKLEGWKPEQ